MILRGFITSAILICAFITDAETSQDIMRVAEVTNESAKQCGVGYEDKRPIPGWSDRYSVKHNGKWGLYDSNTDDLMIPCTLSQPISQILRDCHVVIIQNGTSYLYNKAGEELLCTNTGEVVDIEDGLVYIDNSWTPKGVYSIRESKWIVPYNKYQYVLRLKGGNFACKQDNVHKIISPKGIILNTLYNIKDLNNMDGEYFIRVVDENGKLGILNKTTGRWIVKCLYVNDIAWGAGKGNNRRFALSQKTETGEKVIIMTVGGRKVVSRFFPYGTKPGVIKDFGRKYLYQSF